MSKLDFKTKREWEESVSKTVTPSIPELTDFLKQRCSLLETLEDKTKLKREEKNKTFAHITTEALSCSFCKGKHDDYYCDTFAKLTPDERLAEVARHKICHNCLRPGHFAKSCHSGKCKLPEKNTILYCTVRAVQIQIQTPAKARRA